MDPTIRGVPYFARIDQLQEMIHSSAVEEGNIVVFPLLSVLVVFIPRRGEAAFQADQIGSSHVGENGVKMVVEEFVMTAWTL
jgi:hypothetical protein